MNTADLTGKICMVTGANVGLGKATAMQLAGRGAQVVMVCRNRERGLPAQQEIVEKTGNAAVELLTADFASQRQIRDLAAAYQRTHDRLDVLVNNAGLILGKRTETEDGIETTWAVNHLAPFLLTNLLLDALKAAAPARIVTVSSDAHRSGTINFDDLSMAEKYHWLRAYSQSKLANVLFTYELSRRLDGTGVTATCMHPGAVATRIWNRNRNPISLLMLPFKLFMASPEKSARAIVYLAASPDVEGVTGTYFNRIRETRSTDGSYDEETAARLWQVSAEMVGLAGRG